jgi:hypothetical protein
VPGRGDCGPGWQLLTSQHGRGGLLGVKQIGILGQHA